MFLFLHVKKSHKSKTLLPVGTKVACSILGGDSDQLLFPVFVLYLYLTNTKLQIWKNTVGKSLEVPSLGETSCGSLNTICHLSQVPTMHLKFMIWYVKHILMLECRFVKCHLSQVPTMHHIFPSLWYDMWYVLMLEFPKCITFERTFLDHHCLQWPLCRSTGPFF